MQAIRPALDDIGGLELALAALTQVADLPRRAAYKSKRAVPGKLPGDA